MKRALLLILIVFIQFAQAQTTYFVDQTNGLDTNDGLTAATSFQTFNKAKNQVSAGDTIMIIGEYHNTSYDTNYTYNAPDDAQLWHAENTIAISNLHGTSAQPITICAYDDNTTLKGDGANILRIMNSSYLNIENLTIEGEVSRIPLSTAQALQFVYIIDDGNLNGTVTNPTLADIHYRNEDETNDTDNIVEETDIFTDLSNLSIKRPSYIDTRGFYVSGSHDITIKNNTIHHTCGGGLRVSESYEVTITQNDIYRCSARSYSGTHALVVTKTVPITSDDYTIEITKNAIHHNYNEMYSWAPSKTIITPRIDEGKGISLQRNNTTAWKNGQGRILVANNLTYWNGFSGAHSNDGYRIDFINNTCFMNHYTNSITYQNGVQSGKNVGISAQGGDDIKIINNISVLNAGWNAFPISVANVGDGIGDDLIIKNNLIYDFDDTLTQDSDVTAIQDATTLADPLFVAAPIAYQNENSAFDFHLQATSDAIDTGYNTNVPNEDYYGNLRTDGSQDRGAIEYGATATTVNTIATNSLFYYPNPTKGLVYFNKPIKQTKLALFDALGRKIKTIAVTSQAIDLSSFENGVYFIKLNGQLLRVIKH